MCSPGCKLVDRRPQRTIVSNEVANRLGTVYNDNRWLLLDTLANDFIHRCGQAACLVVLEHFTEIDVLDLICQCTSVEEVKRFQVADELLGPLRD